MHEGRIRWNGIQASAHAFFIVYCCILVRELLSYLIFEWVFSLDGEKQQCLKDLPKVSEDKWWF